MIIPQAHTEKFFARLENSFGLLISSLIIGLLLLSCAMLYVKPSFTTAFHGIYFSQLSEHPFDFSEENRMRYRILAPLLGYITLLRGKYFFILPLLFGWFLISAVYYQYRRKQFSPVIAFLFCCFVAFSCTILIPIIAAGYTDTITYFFLFLAFIRAEHVYQSAAFFALALLNHESAVFLLPALIAYSSIKQEQGILLKTATIFCFASLPHVLYRIVVNAHASVQYSIPFYFSQGNLNISLADNHCRYIPVGAFYAFKLLWIFPFAALYYSFQMKYLSYFLILFLIIAGSFAQLIIAHDYTRMITLAFPAILLSAEFVRNQWAGKKFQKLALTLILLNFLILQYHFTKEGANLMFPAFLK